MTTPTPAPSPEDVQRMIEEATRWQEATALGGAWCRGTQLGDAAHLLGEAATALAQLQAERDRLREMLDIESEDACQWRREEQKEFARAEAAERRAEQVEPRARDAEARAAEATRAAYTDAATIVRGLSSWLRQPGNVWLDDAVDECARAVANMADALAAKAQPPQEPNDA